MKLNYMQIHGAIESLTALAEEKLPFKTTLIMSKNLAALKAEEEFYIEQERKFATEYLEVGEDGNFIQNAPGVFQIKEGKQQECAEARRELDAFETDINLRMIPVSAFGKLDVSINQLTGIEFLLEDDTVTEEE